MSMAELYCIYEVSYCPLVVNAQRYNPELMHYLSLHLLNKICSIQNFFLIRCLCQQQHSFIKYTNLII